MIMVVVVLSAVFTFTSSRFTVLSTLFGQSIVHLHSSCVTEVVSLKWMRVSVFSGSSNIWTQLHTAYRSCVRQTAQQGHTASSLSSFKKKQNIHTHTKFFMTQSDKVDIKVHINRCVIYRVFSSDPEWKSVEFYGMLFLLVMW